MYEFLFTLYEDWIETDSCPYRYRPNAVLRTKIDFYPAFSMQHYRCNHSGFILFISKLIFLSVHTLTIVQIYRFSKAMFNNTWFSLCSAVLSHLMRSPRRTVYNVAHKLFAVLLMEFGQFLTWHRLFWTNTALLRIHWFSWFL